MVYQDKGYGIIRLDRPEYALTYAGDIIKYHKNTKGGIFEFRYSVIRSDKKIHAGGTLERDWGANRLSFTPIGDINSFSHLEKLIYNIE